MIRTIIPESELIEDRWYVGRGRNSNVAKWCRINKNGGLTFVTIGNKFGMPDFKNEGYYHETCGCFQPFALIEEGTVVESVGPTKAGWDKHYAKRLDV